MESEIGYRNRWHDIISLDDLRNHVWECIFISNNFYNSITNEIKK